MHFEISLALKPGKQLTYQQKHNPWFSEAPRIGARIVRQNHPIKLNEQEWRLNQVAIKRLFEAEAIEIVRVEEIERDGKKETIREDLRESIKKHLEAHKKVAEPEEPKGMTEEEQTILKDAEKAAEEAPAAEPTPPTAPPAEDAKPAESQPVPEPAPAPEELKNVPTENGYVTAAPEQTTSKKKGKRG